MIDLLSDTVTTPTQEMRQAIFEAEVGDAGYGEDPTLNRLEALAAEMLGKEDAAFMTSGCQGNLAALLAHCTRGQEVILGDRSDLYDFEAGSVSVMGGLVLHPVPTEADGRLALDNLSAAIRDKSDYQCAPPGVVVLENPHCQRGGRVLPASYIKEVRALADEHSLPLHLDGARIFNAAIASKKTPAELVEDVDSVMFSLSKALAAPFGSIVCGKRVLIERVRRYRKLLGGGLRQAGFMASAGIVALQTMVDRLVEDHRRAQLLANKIRNIPGICLEPSIIDTNMVFFRLEWDGGSIPEFLSTLLQQGVRMGTLREGIVRAVLHYLISDEDVDATANAIQAVLQAKIATGRTA
ncbi:MULTISPECIES: GntG family PLP-dependent aldolase [unclassified Mesorhizobium]|uniref:GntG family PLP-dependent aldolase n=1 Tax=unclassified Mesorhizobium TaxID=325217 RepID=UPI001928FAF2|nr:MULTISPECIES: GntG family PLP-dependent aldolase [unclassified Mesorhizobium]BCG97326.1 threonine aldolase [Mesorhizobium sp. 131-2-1]BCH04397.1 threonine aldolase [Mesorhizobium sp. 131-2-5]